MRLLYSWYVIYTIFGQHKPIVIFSIWTKNSFDCDHFLILGITIRCAKNVIVILMVFLLRFLQTEVVQMLLLVLSVLVKKGWREGFVTLASPRFGTWMEIIHSVAQVTSIWIWLLRLTYDYYFKSLHLSTNDLRFLLLQSVTV